jgi:hypothetical protein
MDAIAATKTPETAPTATAAAPSPTINGADSSSVPPTPAFSQRTALVTCHNATVANEATHGPAM